MMSERIKELAEQAGFEFEEFIEGWIAEDEHIERFAELIRQDERENLRVMVFNLESELEQTQDLLNEYMVREHFKGSEK